MKILMTGGTGLIGRQIIRDLNRLGSNNIVILTRNKESAHKKINVPAHIFEWKDPCYTLPPKDAFEGVDHIIHLAGESVAEGLWNKDKKKGLVESRTLMTTKLIKGLELYKTKELRSFVSASAIGYYGDRGDEVLTENHQRGDGFLSTVCYEWEEASRNASITASLCHIRIGLVLAQEGGILAKMLLPFKLGMGGAFGDGKQWMSWIHIKDLSRLFIFAINNNLNGVYNAVSPYPIRNKEFVKQLGIILNRPTWFTVPRFMLDLTFGDKAQIMTSSQRVSSQKIIDAGFAFSFEHLENALDNILK